MRTHLTSIRIVTFKRTENNKQGLRKVGTLVHCWRESKILQPLWKKYGNSSKKLKIELPYDPPISLLNIYLKVSQKDNYTHIFTAVSFIIAMRQKQPKYHQHRNG